MDPLALVERSTRRCGLLWVTVSGTARPCPLWHVWHDGAAYVVTGGREQPLPRAAGAPADLEGLSAEVAVRNRETGELALRWLALLTVVAPGGPRWGEVTPLLHAARLNAHDGEAQPLRWAATSTVLALTPTGALLPLPDGSGAAPPAATAGPSPRTR